jgi:hypothetical protein
VKKEDVHSLRLDAVDLERLGTFNQRVDEKFAQPVEQPTSSLRPGLPA